MRVLVVEDHAPVAESIRTMLESRKFAANVVPDGGVQTPILMLTPRDAVEDRVAGLNCGAGVDLSARAVSYDGKPVVLGATEFRVLELLARNAGIALSRAQIVERIWDYDFDGSNNNVDVYVSMLRRKLKGLGASGIIETVWGIGYRLRA